MRHETKSRRELTSREIDAKVAEHVMGWTHIQTAIGVPDRLDGVFEGEQRIIPRYSTDISAAWQVVEKIDLFNIYDALRYWGSPLKWQFINNFCDEIDVEVVADTAPMAICLAALKAKGVELE